MENDNDINEPFHCMVCEYTWGSQNMYIELTTSIEDRCVAGTRHLLNQHLDSNTLYRADAEALIHRVFKNTVDITQKQSSIITILGLLIDNGANIDAKDTFQRTVLHLAIKHRLRQVIDYLISRGADLQVCDKLGNYIAHFLIKRESYKLANCDKARENLRALKEQSADFIGWLLPKGFDVDVLNNKGETVLLLAATYNLLHALPILLEHMKNAVNQINMKAFVLFMQSSRRFDRVEKSLASEYWIDPVLFYKTDFVDEVYEKFLNKGFTADVVIGNSVGRTPLHFASYYGLLRVVKLMMKTVKDVNASDKRGNTALYYVVRHLKNILPQAYADYPEIAHLLLTNGANAYQTNNDGRSPLLLALIDKKPFLMELFKQHGIDLHRIHEGNNMLHIFCNSLFTIDCEDHPRIINLLVSEGCDVNANDAKGMTPLHYAARLSISKAAEVLISHGADVNSCCIKGYTPLHEAVHHGRKNVINVLIDNRANVNTKTKDGQTPLHFIKVADEWTVEKLIKCGGHIDVQDCRGLLPLHNAAIRNDDLIMKRLLFFGADINDNPHVVSWRDRTSVARFVTKHLIKLKVAGLYIDDELKFFLESVHDLMAFQERCEKEIENLKSFKVTSSVSLYNFLRMNRNSMCAYIDREELMVDCSVTWKKLFPMYHVLISSALYLAAERRKILDSAKSAWLELTNIPLPDICVAEILNNLSNVHLRVMIEAT